MGGREQKREGEGSMKEITKATIDEKADQMFSLYNRGNIKMNESSVKNSISQIRSLAEKGRGEVGKYYKGWSKENLNNLADQAEGRLKEMLEGVEGKSKESAPTSVKLEQVKVDAPRPSKEEFQLYVDTYSDFTDYGDEDDGEALDAIERYADDSGDRPSWLKAGWTREDARDLVDSVEANRRKMQLKAEL